jgi:multimeric flavodoxin WrbA
MRIIGIIGSPRGNKSSTLKLLESTLKGAADAGAETEIVDITRKKINYCKGCEACYGTGKCFQKDDFQEVFDKLAGADGFVLATPVYFNSVTAQLKTFMDRTSYSRHVFSLEGKYGMSVITTAGSGIPETADLLYKYTVDLGAFSIGNVGVGLPVIPANLEVGLKKAYEMGKDLADAINTKRQYPEQAERQRSFLKTFKHVVKYNKEKWEPKYRHYVEKGWL